MDGDLRSQCTITDQPGLGMQILVGSSSVTWVSNYVTTSEE